MEPFQSNSENTLKHNGKASNYETTKNRYNGHSTHTSESTNIVVYNCKNPTSATKACQGLQFSVLLPIYLWFL